MKDLFVREAVSMAQRKAQGESDPNEKMTVGGGALRFIVSLVWFLITGVILIVSLYAMAAGFIGTAFDFEPTLCYLAIAACLVIGAVTFIVPYLRKKGSLTRWCGIVAIGEAVWWMYLLATGF